MPLKKLTPEILREATKCTFERALVFTDPLIQAAADFGISDSKQTDLIQRRRLAAFIAQCAYETMLFARLEENLNYSADGLRATWPKRFPTADIAQKYARRPMMIANFVYAGRMGNGDEQSGDGWNFRGRSLGHTTGREDYKKCGIALNLPLLTRPECLLEPYAAARAAGWEWKAKNLNRFADVWDIDGCSDVWNLGHKTFTAGDALGYNERLSLSNRVLATT